MKRQLGDSQMGFRKGKGTRDAIFQLRMLMERVTQLNREKLRMENSRKRKRNYACAL